MKALRKIVFVAIPFVVSMISVVYYICHFGTNLSAQQLVDPNTVTVQRSPTVANVHVLIHARMRTGSTLAGSYFATHPDFFYVYEPGYMLIEHNGMDFYEDSFDYLESIRHELTDFMHAFYNCNFTNRDYYFNSLIRHGFMRSQGNIPKQRDRAALLSNVTTMCRSKRHIVTKTIRLNNILLAAPMLRNDKVKIIHLVRDPRGMTSSRSIYGNLKKKNNSQHEERQRQMIKNYCIWLDINFVSVANADHWFKDNYFLIRYEDLSDRPEEFVPKLYDFVGLPMHPTIQKKIQQPGKKIGNGEKWRTKLTYEEVQHIQELCPQKVLKRYGYIAIHNKEELINGNVSLVVPVTDVGKQ